MRFSHDVQGGFGGAQPLAHPGVLPRETGDLGLLGGEPANLSAGPFARQHPGVALLAPFADQRRIQALPPQIGATLTVFARLFVGRQVGKFVRRGERATPPRSVWSRVARIHPFIVVHRGNRGAGHDVPFRISPCVRPICCEPMDSTHPDTQGVPRADTIALPSTSTRVKSAATTFTSTDSLRTRPPPHPHPAPRRALLPARCKWHMR